jgi:hypothetical protein
MAIGEMRGGNDAQRGGELAQQTSKNSVWRFFYGLFYGRPKFCCKSAQFYEKPCQRLTTRTPSVRVDVQHRENVRKTLSSI